MDSIFSEIIKLENSGLVGALATVVAVKGSTPRSVGSKMLVRHDGSIFGSIGGGCLEAEVWQNATEVIRERKPRLLDYDLTGRDENPEGLICGGTMQVFVEPIIPVPALFILGAGHIGFAVSRIARMAGFRVTVVDDRPAYANAQRFPDAAGFVVDDPADAVPSLHINPVSYLVVACRGHLEDQRVLAQALKTPAGYIGMIGSKKKTRTVLDNLRSEGFSDDDLKRIHAPIGLPVAAETPEEIAISIMAEIVACRRQYEKTADPALKVS